MKVTAMMKAACGKNQREFPLSAAADRERRGRAG